ncbi:Spherulation-specific family 4 [Aspergillus carlsbadensis]|nr:Spherulation-specific family 4 [Aspergillus carlsbadensis]
MPSFTHYLAATLASITSASATGVLLPLYTWPSEGAWDPVYDALAAYPEVDFYVIVNPNSGPGDSSPPASEYITGVTTLNSYANAHTIGYVRTNWADRDMDDVKQDIDVYSQWASYSGSGSGSDSSSSSTTTAKKRAQRARRFRSPCSNQDTYTDTAEDTGTEPIATASTSTTGFVTTTTSTVATPTYTSSTSTPAPSSTGTPANQNTGITLSGIFFDEAPQSSDESDLSFMQEAAEYVSSHSAHFPSTSNTTIIFNPGTAPDTQYFNYATHIVDFESTYDAWLGSEQKSGAGGLIDGVEESDYTQSAIIINSVPGDVDYAAVVAAAVERGVAMVYLTGDFDYKNLGSVGDVAAAILGA